MSTPETHELLTRREVAELFRVNPEVVTRWAKAGKIRCLTTPGGHRRYYRAQVLELLKGGTDGQA